MTMGNARRDERRNFPQPRGRNMQPVGNVLPRQRYTPKDVAEAQGEVLRGVFGTVKTPSGLVMQTASPAKEQARVTGQSERACRNQQNGENCMALHEFFNACQVIPDLRSWGAMMMGLEQEDPEQFQRELARGTREITLRIDVNNAAIVQQGGPATSDPLVRDAWNLIDKREQRARENEQRRRQLDDSED
jgi:hypothetical protein